MAASEARAVSAIDEALGGVCTLRDELDNVVRTSRSSDLAAREAAHANDPILGRYRFQVEYRTNDYAEQRGLEELIYRRHPGAMAANGGYNKIGAISARNRLREQYMRAATNYLDRWGQ